MKTLVEIVEEVVIDSPHLCPLDRVHEAYRRFKALQQAELEVERLEANW